MRREDFNVIQGNCIDTLKTLPNNSVQCCVTSPPYYGLRDYGTARWEGEDPNCPHYRTNKISKNTCTGHKSMSEKGHPVGDAIYKTICPLCGAVRVDSQIGLEETPDEYISKLVEVFREVKRVLKNDGTLWVNIGDTYNGTKHGNTDVNKHTSRFMEENNGFVKQTRMGAKPKDLIGIPWMLAFALREDGWYLRQDIIWAKGNAMPESVTDRCTKSHEYIFLLSKSQKYLFNYQSIQEVATGYDGRKDTMLKGCPKYAEAEIMPGNNIQSFAKNGHERWKFVKIDTNRKFGMDGINNWCRSTVNDENVIPIRNKRDVWNINVNSYKGAHFATYPTKLVEPCVLAGSNVGDTILDPFSGSGTTGIVSLLNGRKYIGCELNQEYINLSYDRLDQEIFGESPICAEDDDDGGDMKKISLDDLI